LYTVTRIKPQFFVAFTKTSSLDIFGLGFDLNNVINK